MIMQEDLSFEANPRIRYRVEANGCWKCTSHRANYDGYRQIKFRGKQLKLHRYIYEMVNGAIRGETVRHRCDNRWCINPDHLIEGTHQDNVADRVARNRSAVGPRNGRSKLSEDEALAIYHDNVTPKAQIARKFNVDPKVVWGIKNKMIWKYLTANL